jgi:hypothetical protein
MDSPQHETTDAPAGTGDHDVPYTFGRRPRASAPYPFSTRQYARLLVLRSRVQAGLVEPAGGAREETDTRELPSAA